ncbi:hypothetical protein VSR82_07705 [Burkholderia sp. JPY481]
MSEFKGTPGPWRAEEWTRHAPTTILVDEPHQVTGKRIIAEFYSVVDARLGAAAPELLNALEQLLIDMTIAQGNMRDAAKRDPRWEGCAEAIQPRVDAARAAIAKATGSQS